MALPDSRQGWQPRLYAFENETQSILKRNPSFRENWAHTAKIYQLDNSLPHNNECSARFGDIFNSLIDVSYLGCFDTTSRLPATWLDKERIVQSLKPLGIPASF
jgi:hypothetical protein